MGCGGREDVAAVEGGGDGGLDHPVLVGDFVGGGEAVAIQGRSEDAVVWGYEVLVLFGFGDDGFAAGAYAGVDDDQEDGVGRVVRGYAGEEAGGFFDGVGRDLVGDVGQADVGGNTKDYGAADGDGIIGGAE